MIFSETLLAFDNKGFEVSTPEKSFIKKYVIKGNHNVIRGER